MTRSGGNPMSVNACTSRQSRPARRASVLGPGASEGEAEGERSRAVGGVGVGASGSVVGAEGGGGRRAERLEEREEGREAEAVEGEEVVEPAAGAGVCVVEGGRGWA